MSYVNSSRAFAYLTERGEDALYAVKGAIGTGSSKYLSGLDKTGSIRAQLESTSDVDHLEGLKYVVAMISKGRDATPYLASVFKLASTSSLEVRKLMYIVVLRYAPQHPDLALMSINSFQRDLTAPNALIRGMALRALSGMRVKDAWSIVGMAVGKAVRDTHPYVRRVAAYALMRCDDMGEDHRGVLLEHLDTLLQDRSPEVLGPAVAAYVELCPEDWTRLHRHFRKLCYALADMDEWSQPLVIDVLIRYARSNLPEPHTSVDPDLALLLESVHPLLASMNPAVVMAGVRALLTVGPKSAREDGVRALLRLLREPPEVAYIACVRLLALCTSDRALLLPHTTSFYVRATDPAYLASAKLRVLVSLVEDTHAKTMADEFVLYTQAASPLFAVESVTALGQIACRYEAAAGHCLKRLIGVAQDAYLDEAVTSRAVQVAKMLMTAIPHVASDKVVLRIVAQLALRLFVPLVRAGRSSKATPPPILLDPASRSAALWMLGQYSLLPLVPTDTADEGLPRGATLCELLVPDVLRCFTAHWHKEHPSVQCQALALSAKTMVVLPSTHAPEAVQSALTTLHYALLALGSQSPHADVRDRARFYSGLTRRLGDEDEPTTSEAALHPHWAAHQQLDRLRLPGVRLRRPQARHILFAEEEGFAASMAAQLRLEPLAPPALEGLPAVVGEVHLRGSQLAHVPAWREASELPPAIVRTPTTDALHPAVKPARSLSSRNTTSIASSDVPAADKVVLTPKEPQPVARPSAWNARYANLDSFLDQEESASDAESLDTATIDDADYPSDDRSTDESD